MNATNLDGDREIRYSINLQKHLLEIKKLADKHPNSGQLKKHFLSLIKNALLKSLQSRTIFYHLLVSW